MNARRMIAAYFYDYAAWCRQKSLLSDQPAEDRCVADQYEGLASHVLSLPEDDRRLHVLAKFTIYDGMDVVAPGPMLSSVIANYQNRMPADFDVLLDMLVDAAVDDSRMTAELDREYASILH